MAPDQKRRALGRITFNDIGPQERKRVKVQHLWEGGIKETKNLAKMTGLSPRGINKIKKKLINEESLVRKEGGGRPGKLNFRHQMSLIMLMIRNPAISTREMSAHLHHRFDLSFHQTSIVRFLNKRNWINLKPRSVPMLTELQKKKRLAWCVAHKDTDWSKVCFSDESMFQKFANNIKLWMRKDQKLTMMTPKHGPKLMVWGAISSRGSSVLKIISGSVNSEAYMKILEECTQSLEELFPDGWILQQDNAPPHVSKVTKQWFSTSGLQVLDWPPASPDLNPIENVWGTIKRAVSKKRCKTVDQWRKAIENQWIHLDIDYLASLAASMPRRVQLCIEANGDTIKY